MPKVVHFEIPVDEPRRATAFYRDALGWEVSSFGEEPYWLVQAGGPDEPGADGALLVRGEIHRAPVLVVGVEDLDATLERVAASGGEVLQGRMEIPGIGWSAYFRDPEGNTMGLFEPTPSASG